MSGGPGALTADPAAAVLLAVVVGALAIGLVALFPSALLLLSIVGLLPADATLSLNLLAFPTLAVGIFCVVVALVTARDLQLPRPVLTIDANGVFDRRVTDATIAWSEVEDVSMSPSGRAVQLLLRNPRDTRVSPYRAGTIGVRTAEASVALIPVSAMTRPARELAEAIFAAAEHHDALAEAR